MAIDARAGLVTALTLFVGGTLLFVGGWSTWFLFLAAFLLGLAVATNLQIQERAQDAPYGSQFIRSDRAKTAVKALICHRPRVLGPGEGGELAQARRLRSDRNLVTKTPVPARDGYHEDDRMRQRQVQRAGNDDNRPPAGLFRSDDRIQVSEPHVTRTQRLAHSSSSPSPTA